METQSQTRKNSIKTLRKRIKKFLQTLRRTRKNGHKDTKKKKEKI